MFRPRWILAAGLALAAALAPPRAHAQLHALTHERATGSAQLALVDATNGALTPIGSGLAGCCELGNAAVANDPFAQDVYAVGPDPASATGALRLVRISLPSGAGAVVGPLGSSDRVVSLAFEQSTQRLIAALADAGGNLRLANIDRATGAASTLHTGLTDCCVLEPGVSALAGGRLLLVGRLKTDPAGTRTLYALSTSGDNSVTTTPLPAGTALAAMATDPVSGLVYGLAQSFSAPPRVASAQLVRVVPGSGLVNIGAPLAGCCAVALDTVAVEGGALRLVATNPLASGLSLLSFNLTTGAASFSAAPLPATHVVDGLFDLAKGLSPSTTTITSVAPPSPVIGQPYTVNVSVTSPGGTPTGTVLVTDGLGGSCSIVLPATSCVLSATQVGPLTLTAAYPGAGSIAGSDDTENITVGQASSTTTISSVVPSPSVVGQNYTVNVTVTGFAPTGNVTVSDGLGGSCMIALPASSCVLGSANAGPRTLTANYPGDINNLPSSGSAAHNVTAAPSATTIVSIVPSPAVVGQAYTVTVSVTGFGVPGGSVTVTDGNGASCTIVLPATNCPLTTTAAGNRSISASYGGDNNNLPSSASQPLVVQRAPSTTIIGVIAPSPGVAGQPYTVNVAVTGYGTLAGTIAVSDGTGGSCTITLPAGSCALTSLTAGNKTLTASYSGDLNNLPSSDTEAQIVNPAPTTTTLAAQPNPAIVGSSVTLTASIGAGVAPRSGTVAFTADGNPIAGCAAMPVASDTAVCTTTFTTVGTRAVSASYSGDANNLPSAGNLSLLVERAPTTTVLSAQPNPVAPGAPVLLTATVTGGYGGLSGTVSFSSGGVAIPGCQNLALVAGVAQCSTSFATPGTIALTVSYSGDIDDQPSSGASSLQVLLVSIPALDGPALTLLGLLLLGLGLAALRPR